MTAVVDTPPDTLPALHLERISHEVILRSMARKLRNLHVGAFGAEIAALERIADDLVTRTAYEKATGVLRCNTSFEPGSSYCDVTAPTGHHLGHFYAPDLGIDA